MKEYFRKSVPEKIILKNNFFFQGNWDFLGKQFLGSSKSLSLGAFYLIMSFRPKISIKPRYFETQLTYLKISLFCS